MLERLIMFDLFNGFYRGKRVLVTGHTGFKGSWLCLWLRELGAEIAGYALDPENERDNFVLSGLSADMRDIRGDIRDAAHLNRVFDEFQPEIVFHLAAQPLVRLSYEKPVETYETNVMGTIHVLEAFRRTPSARAGVFITTDKCYENREQLRGCREDDPMGGHDPYSSSKGACEIAISSWRRSFLPLEGGRSVASARAGNVIGGGDWAKDRLIPDCVRALEKGRPAPMRNPGSVRPWQHVLEPLRGYLMLAEALRNSPADYAGGWNFGPDSVHTVGEVVNCLVEEYGTAESEYTPENAAPHEAGLLVLDSTKAHEKLGWKTVLDLRRSIALTADWYRRIRTESAAEICREELAEYIRICKNQNNMERI